MSPGRLVILSQTYPPDTAAAGQYLHEAAVAMTARGWRVTVITADRGFDDPSQRYPRDETRDGVQVTRLMVPAINKSSLFSRLLLAGFFLVRARDAFPSLSADDRVLVSTSPPFAPIGVPPGIAAPMIYWVMDINPDQAVALGRVPSGAFSARLLDGLSRSVMRRAAEVVTLDGLMADRLEQKSPGIAPRIIPPWPLTGVAEDADGAARLRGEHGWEHKFVVMHAGNHTPSSPLDEALAAARELREHPTIRFAFIGGGTDKPRINAMVRDENLTNVTLLPYQPLNALPAFLSAADVHLAATHPALVGICHPSKPYSALAVGRPVIFLGPADSPVARMLIEHGAGWVLPPVVERPPLSRLLIELAEMSDEDRRAYRLAALAAVEDQDGVNRLCGLIEGAGTTR